MPLRFHSRSFAAFHVVGRGKRTRGAQGSPTLLCRAAPLAVVPLKEWQAHADQIAQRIVELGGEPNLSPEGLLNRSHSEYIEGEPLVEMITEDLIAEQIAIDSYREMVASVGTDDSTTRPTTENLNALVAQARDGVEHAAGALGDTVHRVHETVQGTSGSLLVTLASLVAGFRATTAVVKARIHREGGTFHGR